MRRVLRSCLILSLLLSCSASVWAEGLPSAPPQEVGLSSSRLERIDKLFQDSIDNEEMAGVVALIARRGKTAYFKSFGIQDKEAKTAMPKDALFRVASQTKAVTSVAAMLLFEEGKFLLDDPLSDYLPEFANANVLSPSPMEGLAPTSYSLVPAHREITIRDLLCHTSGLTYGFWDYDDITERYRGAGISDGLAQTEGTVGDMVKKLAAVPLVAQPGEAWTYGLSTDVLGYLIETLSGMRLDEFFRKRIFIPLQMHDTCFYVPSEKQKRLAPVYTPSGTEGLKQLAAGEFVFGSVVLSTRLQTQEPKTYFSGGIGLVSTVLDYARFLQMLLNGGELDGVRLLSRKTVEIMTVNQIGDLQAGETGYEYGMGFSVHQGPEKTGRLGSKGDYGWGGLFYTRYWVDPVEKMIGVSMTQIYPNEHLNVLDRFRVLAYQAIAD